MQYYKIIEQSEYDNSGNSVDQTRYEIIGTSKKIHICSYDYCFRTPSMVSIDRKLEVFYCYDMMNYKPILTYFENNKVPKYIYHENVDTNLEIYELIKKIFDLKNEQNKQNNSKCVVT